METRVLLGARLPSPYYERVTDKLHCRLYRRQCAWCNLEWLGAEVAIGETWDGVLADCCPGHIALLGRVAHGNPATAVLKQKRIMRASVIRCVLMGGYQRRRTCTDPFCDQRWTTFEFMSDGTIVLDVAVCVRCGGPGRTVGNAGRMGGRKTWIKHVTTPVLKARMAQLRQEELAREAGKP